MMLPCAFSGKCQQEWIWAHQWAWVAIIAAVNIAGFLVGSIIKARRGR